MGRQVVVPLENIGRTPLADFGRVWDQAEIRFAMTLPDEGAEIRFAMAIQDEQARYLGAVAVTFRWIAGEATTSPIEAEAVRANPATMRGEMHRAADVVYGRGDRRVSEDWALGVMNTLAWVLGVSARPPIKPDARR